MFFNTKSKSYLIGVPHTAQIGILVPGATEGLRMPRPRRGAGLDPAKLDPAAVGVTDRGLVVAPIGDVGIHAETPGLPGLTGAATCLADTFKGENGLGPVTDGEKGVGPADSGVEGTAGLEGMSGEKEGDALGEGVDVVCWFCCLNLAEVNCTCCVEGGAR